MWCVDAEITRSFLGSNTTMSASDPGAKLHEPVQVDVAALHAPVEQREPVLHRRQAVRDFREVVLSQTSSDNELRTTLRNSSVKQVALSFSNGLSFPSGWATRALDRSWPGSHREPVHPSSRQGALHGRSTPRLDS